MYKTITGSPPLRAVAPTACDWVFRDGGKVVTSDRGDEYYVVWTVAYRNNEHSCAVIRFDVAREIPEHLNVATVPTMPDDDTLFTSVCV